jgi:hypothetical protein
MPKNKAKEENKMTNKFLVKKLVQCFGETRTIKMLNQMQKARVNKKAKKHRASLKIQ